MLRGPYTVNRLFFVAFQFPNPFTRHWLRVFYFRERLVYIPEFKNVENVSNRHIYSVSFLRINVPHEYRENKSLANKIWFTVTVINQVYSLNVSTPCKYNENIVAAFRLECMCRLQNIAMRDYQERVTTGETDIRTDRRCTKWSPCVAMLCSSHDKLEPHGALIAHLSTKSTSVIS